MDTANFALRKARVGDQKNLYRLLKALLNKWQLTESQQVQLLGFPLSAWSEMSHGDAVASAALEQAASLLKIHCQLRILFPSNPTLRYEWITTPNRAFNQRTPLSILCEDGGMASVASYLEAATLA